MHPVAVVQLPDWHVISPPGVPSYPAAHATVAVSPSNVVVVVKLYPVWLGAPQSESNEQNLSKNKTRGPWATMAHLSEQL